MAKKFIRQEYRIILIENELTNPKEWKKLFDSLTLAEGMAMGTAISEWSKPFSIIKER